jgi:ribonuclease P protein component
MKLKLNKSYGLSSKGEFRDVYDGKRLENDSFIVYNCEKAEGNSRLAVVVSKKYGTSVKRNLVRRKIKEYFRKNHNRELNKDFVIIPKRKVKIELSDLDNYIN